MAASVARGCCLCQMNFAVKFQTNSSLSLFRRYPTLFTRGLQLQSTEVETQNDIQKPKKKKRDRLTVLKAMSSTVGKIQDRPDYRFVDDVILNPRSLVKKKELLLAIESGTKAAEYVLEKYPDLFPFRKPVPAWPESSEISDDIETSIENLQVLMQSNGKIDIVVDMYEKLKVADSLPIEIHNQMLDFAAFHAIPGNKDDIIQQVTPGTPSSSNEENNDIPQESDNKSSWRSDGYAEKLFLELKDFGSSQTYEVFILELLHHGEFVRAYNTFNEFREKSLTGRLFLYNSLLSHVVDVRDGDQDRWNLVKDVIDVMKASGVKADVVTFNAVLSVAAERENDGSMMCQKIFGEMLKANISPSLGTLYYVLSSERRKGGIQDIQVLLKVMDELKSGRVNFNLVHPADIEFFHSAMDMARFKRNGDVARDLLDIVLTKGLQHMLGPRSSSFYGNYLCAISRTTSDLDYVLQQYQKIVPKIITPRDWVYEQLFFAARNNKNPCFVPKLYSDIVALRVPLNERVITSLFSAMEQNIPEDRADEFLHVVKDCESAIEVFNVQVSSAMLSTFIKILCINKLSEDAIEFAKKYKEHSATPSRISLKMVWVILLHILALSLLTKCEPTNDKLEKEFQHVEGDGYLFQGDMILSRKEIQTALHGGDVDQVNLKVSNGYGLQNSKYRKWPNRIVPYDISGIKNKLLGKLGLMGATETAARKAMKAWEEKTCIRFVERTNEKNYLQFIDDGYGRCFSYVGCLGVGAQKLSLGFECFYKGIAIHEIGHALGLHHEQSRPDRDDYIEVVWDNIKESRKAQFKKYSHKFIDSLGSPYDYDSIMHYRSTAFAKFPFMKTIRSKNPSVSFGQRSHISVQDAWQINKYYGCNVFKSLLKILELNIEENDQTAALDTLKFMANMKLQFDDTLNSIITESELLSEKRDKIKSWFEVRAKS